jgi:hypothetical protein
MIYGLVIKFFWGTVGLWEQVTKQSPENYEENDVANYLTILRQTAQLEPDETI